MPPKGLAAALDQALARVPARDALAERRRTARAEGLDLLDDRRALVGIAPVDDDVRSFLRQCDGVGVPQAAGRPGDDGALPCE